MWWWSVGAHAAPCGLAVADGRVPNPGLAFASRTATLTEASGGAVDAVACLLAASAEVRLHIEVHTDSMGADTYNLTMSQRRADALREALLARGVDPGHVSASGCGEQFPIAPNTTAEGRAQNARIELWTPGPPDRPACRVVDVPPAVPAAPAPAPARPAPWLPTDCRTWQALSKDAPPIWPNVPCETGATGWTCTLAVPPEAVVTAAWACLPGQWDGPQWLSVRAGWALVVGPGPSGKATVGAR